MNGIVYLEDGTVYKGTGFGAKATRVGELVFNTAMTGYQKTLTDPSYKEQILTMTYPLIGNYGINDVDFESDRIHAFGVIANDVCFRPSNWRCVKDIDTWLREQDVPGVYNVDTREITRKIRNGGNQKCVITTEDLTLDQIKAICETSELRGDQMKDAGVTMPEKQFANWD
ncbi:MAG: carbamoyl-phosphate synthase domain-containing protein, partial [Anaerovoracaceae bacterium]